MNICLQCIKESSKKLPFIEKIPYELINCKKCNLNTQQIPYEAFKEQFFAIIEKNYIKLDKLPKKEIWYYFLHVEDDILTIQDIIESLSLVEEIENKLFEDIPNDDNYVLNHYSLDDEYTNGVIENSWVAIEEKFKHKNRFFNNDLIQLLNKAFSYISTNKMINKNLVNIVKADDELYRGRSFNSLSELKNNIPSQNYLINGNLQKYKSELIKNFGVVPSELATNQRMTPEGISCLYLSTDINTCLAEIRAIVGQYVGIICLKSNRDLKLLDLNLLQQGLNAHHLDENYIEKTDVYSFFKTLISKISMPKLNNNNSSYLISQFFFEYLRVYFGDQLDGVILKSIQKPDYNNIILFPELTENGIGTDKYSTEAQPIYFFWPTRGFKYKDGIEHGREIGSESELGIDISIVSSIQISRERYQPYDFCENKKFGGYLP